MIKVLITDKLAQEGIDLINAADGAEAVVKTGISEDELASIIGEYDGLIIRSATKVTPKVLANPGKLKGITSEICNILNFTKLIIMSHDYRVFLFFQFKDLLL